MYKLTPTFLCFLILACSCKSRLEQVERPIQWSLAALPFHPVPGLTGVEIAVLEGNPKEQGLYTIRLKAPPGFTIGPHIHTGHERVTVLSGSIRVAFPSGKLSDRSFESGDYYVNPAGMVHTIASGPAGVLVQVTGIGPWQTELVKSN
jgi:hypothetical protein